MHLKETHFFDGVSSFFKPWWYKMQEFGKEKFCEILELIINSQVVKKNRKN